MCRRWAKGAQPFVARAMSSMAEIKCSVLPGEIYFVSTPIGNLGDMGRRALDVLSSADVIVAEDTRHTLKLLRFFGIDMTKRRLLSHHEHNTVNSIPGLLSLLRQGNSLAVVSDAGTPGISDPGTELAAKCLSEGIRVHSVPGPCAVSSAVSVSGFGGPFTFVGYPPSGKANNKERGQMFSLLQSTKHAVVFFESPHRLKQTMLDLKEVLYGTRRPIVVCKELSKMHEEIRRFGDVAEILSWIEDKLESEGNTSGLDVRGEFCLVLGPVTETSPDAKVQDSDDGNALIVNLLQKLRADGVARSAAVKLVSEMTRKSRSIIYKTALEIDW